MGRIIFFDILKLFAIFCVCFGHCIQHLITVNPPENNVFRFIYSFHMPLFMCIVGYFMFNKNNNIDVKSSISKKFRQLILPAISFWLLFSIIRGFPQGLMFFNAFSNYWFLTCAFICSSIYILANYASNKWGGYTFWVILSLVIGLLIIPYNVFRLYPAFLTGVLIHKYESFLNKYSRQITEISTILFILMFLFLKPDFYGPQNFEKFQNIIITGYHLLYRIVIGSVASLALISICICLKNFFSKNKLLFKLSKIGTYTLGIYVIQNFIIEILLREFLNFDNYNIFIFYLIITPCICIITITFSLIIIKILEKSKFLNYFFLGKGNYLYIIKNKKEVVDS